MESVQKMHTTDDQDLEVQNSYLFTYNIFIKILYMFRALPCSSSGGVRRNCMCVWYRHFVKSELSPEAAYIRLRRRSEDEQGNARNM